MDEHDFNGLVWEQCSNIGWCLYPELHSPSDKDGSNYVWKAGGPFRLAPIFKLKGGIPESCTVLSEQYCCVNNTLTVELYHAEGDMEITLIIKEIGAVVFNGFNKGPAVCECGKCGAHNKWLIEMDMGVVGGLAHKVRRNPDSSTYEYLSSVPVDTGTSPN